MIPYDWISFCDENPVGPGVRWDSAWLERFLTGQEWRVPGGFALEHRPLERGEGGILIFPCGHYYDHREASRVLTQIQAVANSMEWCVLIATSDEGSKFPWWRFRPNHLTRLWVQTPRTDLDYPRGSRFIGFGSPNPASAFPVHDGERANVLFFSGQVTHERRYLMWAALQDWIEVSGESRYDIMSTQVFASGHDQEDYRDFMRNAMVVPAPSGPETQDSFRCYEALEAGAVPLQDALRPGGKGAGYWDMIGLNLMEIENWNDIGAKIETAKEPLVQAQVSAGWQQHKRGIAHRIHDDVAALSEKSGEPTCTADLITAIVLASPSPLHPDPSITIETIESVTSRIPNVEVLVGCDGVRFEQEEREPNYFEYLHRLTQWTLRQRNVAPFLFQKHHHQSGMLYELLPLVKTPYVLFMEHDAPLVGEIDFHECLNMMLDFDLSILRFSHEAGVLPDHHYLFLESTPQFGAPFVRTIQYSARPHIISTEKFRTLLTAFFGTKSRTFLEDTLYGALQYHPLGLTDRDAIWNLHHMAVYAPEGSWKRSEHLDGRAGDPKYPTFIHYDEGRPEGAPPAGRMVV